jgi:3-oxoacyl-[acyl-carrier protein] reductase
MRLDGKFALVTGGGSGIGREICLTFAREGAHVAVNDLRPEGIQETIKMMGEAAARAVAAPADVADSRAVDKAVADVVRRYGTLDILVNNAGIGEVNPGQNADRMNTVAEQRLQEMMSGGPITTSWEATQTLTDEDFDRMLRVHLYGTFHCTRAALRIMEPKRYGHIVNMSSIAGTVGLEGIPHYCAAKAAILGFTRSVAREVGSRNITVNAIAPGYIETPMTSNIPPIMRQMWIMSTPLQKSGQPSDIANAALYLASDEANFVTGQIISPNGGWWMP